MTEAGESKPKAEAFAKELPNDPVQPPARKEPE